MIGLCAGVYLIPYTALFTAYTSEVVFPIPEGSATGYLFAVSQTFGFLAGIGTIAVIDNSEGENEWKVFVMMGGHAFCILASALVVASTK